MYNSRNILTRREKRKTTRRKSNTGTRILVITTLSLSLSLSSSYSKANSGLLEKLFNAFPRVVAPNESAANRSVSSNFPLPLACRANTDLISYTRSPPHLPIYRVNSRRADEDEGASVSLESQPSRTETLSKEP